MVIPRPATDLDQVALGPVQRPGRLERAALLAAVGVADHDLLEVAREAPGAGGRPGKARSRSMIAEAVCRGSSASKRGTMSSRLTPSSGRNKPGLAGQQEDFEEVGRVGGRADDVLIDRLGALPFEDRGDGPEGPDHLGRLGRVVEVRRDQRAGRLQLLGQEVEPLVGGEFGDSSGRRPPLGGPRRGPRCAWLRAGGGRGSGGGRRRPRRAGSCRGSRPRPPPSAPDCSRSSAIKREVGEQLAAAEVDAGAGAGVVAGPVGIGLLDEVEGPPELGGDHPALRPIRLVVVGDVDLGEKSWRRWPGSRGAPRRAGPGGRSG